MANNAGITIQSVARALQVLECFTGKETELGITQIAAQMDLNKSTAYGLVNTLVAFGYLEQNQTTRQYRLGIKLFEMGSLVERRMDLRTEARPYLKELAEEYRATVHLASFSEGEVVYIDKVDIPDAFIIYSQIGKRAPMYCTGVGKAILAYMPEEYLETHVLSKPLTANTPKTITSREKLIEELENIRRRGYAMDDEELEIGLRCIAVPVFGAEGNPIAALSVSAPLGRFPTEKTEEIAERIQKDSRQISARLGYRL